MIAVRFKCTTYTRSEQGEVVHFQVVPGQQIPAGQLTLHVSDENLWSGFEPGREYTLRIEATPK